ncbi:MAG: tryptophan synthase subunit alpha [Bacteroidaceae bacterium]
MNRINELFQRKNKNLLSLYFCAGYPTLNGTIGVLEAMQTEGIDFVEIGIPFSDPIADGPVIQEASTKALQQGMSLKLLFSQLRNVRNTVNLPIILMGYLNPIFQYGFEKFCNSCKECSIDGVIIPDLPFSDYLKTYKAIADKYDFRIIMLITPETSDERIERIDQQTNGFIYMVSSASTTGIQTSFGNELQDYFNHVNAMNLRNPRMIGFGVSNKKTLKSAQQNATGAIIGSLFIHLQSQYKSPQETIRALFKTLEKDRAQI